MFDAPLDAWYVWLGLGAVSVAVAGTALSLPTAAPPASAPVADAVDTVAASPNEASSSVALSADEIRLSGRTVALRTDGGTARARLAFGPVTPVRRGVLRRVLDGAPPERTLSSQRAFRNALTDARNSSPEWRAAPDRLAVRRVEWGDVHATLVG